MCGRGSLTKVEKDLEKRFGSTFYSEDLERYNPLPNFNIAPTQKLPVILQEDQRHFRPVQWGLIPSWAKDAKIGSKMINARVEGLLEKPFFKSALLHRRCLVPMDGFYEWRFLPDKHKIPHRIGIKGFGLFSMAGIYDRWKNDKGEVITSFSIITLPSNKFMQPLHDRMPAMLLQEEERFWLDPGEHSGEDLIQMIKPFPDDLMDAYPVSDRVNSVRNNDKSLIEKEEMTS
ncbi:MAG: SOS response-associated peptidase [Saprospiraceae bacterium]|nr:SOS response-associated peptidase [Candidatus Vicinibacter affinis]